MTLKHVERIRERIVRGQVGELSRLRTFVSMTDGNQVAVDSLRGEVGNVLLGRITELILEGLGHETDTPVEASASKVRREVARVRGKARDDHTEE